MPLQSVSFTKPGMSPEQRQFDRQRQIAMALQQQAFQPDQTQMAGGYAIPTGILGPVAKIAQAWAAKSIGERADKGEQDYIRQTGEDRSRLLAEAMRAGQGMPAQNPQSATDALPGEPQAVPAVAPDPRRTYEMLAGSQYPDLQQYGLHGGMQYVTRQQEQATTLQARQQAQAAELQARQQEQEAARQFREQEAAARREERRQDLEMRLQDARLSREERANLQRELQRNQLESRREMAGLAAAVRQSSDAAAGRPPAGYRFKPDGNLESIPGGPADTRLRGQFNQDTASLQSAENALDRLEQAANEVYEHKGLSRTTGMVGIVPNVPGFPGADAESKLEQLKSQAGFAVLQAMRDASKTGGALGNVSNFEVQQLQNNLAALQKAQSYDQIRKELTKIKQYTQEAKTRLRNAYNLKHGEGVATGQRGASGEWGGTDQKPSANEPRMPSAAEIEAEIARRRGGR